MKMFGYEIKDKQGKTVLARVKLFYQNEKVLYRDSPSGNFMTTTRSRMRTTMTMTTTMNMNMSMQCTEK